MAVLSPTPFCTLTDVQNLGFPPSALGALTVAAQQAAVDWANGIVGARLAGRYPGINLGGSGWSWDSTVVGIAVDIARWRALNTRGRQPSTTSGDKVIDDAYKMALDMLHDIESQNLHPAITGGEQAGATSQGPVFISTSTLETNSACRAPNRMI